MSGNAHCLSHTCLAISGDTHNESEDSDVERIVRKRQVFRIGALERNIATPHGEFPLCFGQHGSTEIEPDGSGIFREELKVGSRANPNETDTLTRIDG